ncbi:MAG: hypothetical protein HQM10_18105 [Candidatus Riflebacteria bacterium]|nr:hypothetical protein [Candidatus Riflebacteria bacterium]
MNTKIKCLLLVVVLALLASMNNPAEAVSVPEAVAAGDACYQKGDFGGALWHFTAAKDLNPKDPGLWEKLSWTLTALGRTDEAISFADQSKNLGMDNTRVSRMKGWAYLRKADDQRAAGDLTNAKTNYEHARNMAANGVDNDLGGRANAALGQISGPTGASGANTTIVEKVKAGDACYQSKDYTTALAHFTAARDLNPADPGLWEKMAWTYGAMGKLTEALSHIDEAKKRGLDDGRCARVKGWSHFTQAEALKAAGDNAGAKAQYEHARNHAATCFDKELGERAVAELAKLSASTTSSTASTSTSSSVSTSTSSTSSTALSASGSSTSSVSTSTSSSSSSTTASSSTKIKQPTKEEIENRIKGFASKEGFTTYTATDGRLKVKNSKGEDVQLPPDIFAPSGNLPGKEVIEARIQKWAAKMGYTTATDPHGRMGVKNKSGEFVALPPSIFFPETDESAAGTASDPVSTLSN